MTTAEREFAGVEFGAHQARKWLAALLETAGITGEAADIAALVLAELVSNTVRHTRSGQPGGTFHVVLRVGVNCLRLEVADQGSDTSEPRVARAGPYDAHLRGLALVDTLTRQWGTRVRHCGRLVFAEIAHNQPPPSTRPGYWGPEQ